MNEIGKEAKKLEKKDLVERMKITKKGLSKIMVSLVIYSVIMISMEILL